MSGARTSWDNDDTRKSSMALKTNFTICWSSSLIRSIATVAIANEIEKMEGKDVFKYSLKGCKKAETLPTKTYVKLSSEGGVTIVSDLLFQR